MQTRNFMAFDLGASNGRAIVGRFDGKKIIMEEIHRFQNEFLDCNGINYWDALYFFREMRNSLSQYAVTDKTMLSGMGIDTWGVDFGLLDENDQLLGNIISYRDSLDSTMEQAWKIVPRKDLYMRTGTAHQNFNTLYQLYARRLRNDPVLNNAKTMLFTPDLLGFFLTGEKGTEYTIASTGMLYDPIAKNWDYELLKKYDLPEHILTPIQASGVQRGCLRDVIANELGCGKVPFYTVGEHDTASAVAAVPGKGNFAFLSSGTWSLFGAETDKPILTDLAYEANYSNEGTVQGGFRPLRNIMGLWLIQCCKRLWDKRGEVISYNDIVAQAKASKPFESIIDPDFPDFFSSTNMEKSIQNYCEKTGQAIPQTKGEIAQCIYQSLALKYRWALERLHEITGREIEALHIVGGGIQNKLLNQYAANAIRLPVHTGPIEGACIGNLLVQAMACGEIASLAEIREVVSNSFELQTYLPQDEKTWEDAYGKLLMLIEKQESIG